MTADQVFVNAVVRTLDGSGVDAEAVAVTDGVVVAVGDAAAVDRWRGPATEVVDCAGDVLLPGFVDGHCHFEMTCLAIDHGIKAHTPPHRSLAEVRAAIVDQLPAVAADDWVICRSSFDMHEKVEEGRLFTRQELDAICPDRPMMVYASLHVSSMNTAAFEQMGLLGPTSVHGQAGFVHRDADGLPTGPVTEMFLLMPEIWGGEAFDAAVVANARRHFSAAGTTTVCTMPESLGQLRRLEDLHAARRVSVRQRYYLIHPSVASLDTVVEHARREGDDWLSFGGMKVFVNGCAHDGLGAQLDDTKWTQAELDAAVRTAHDAGVQVWLHSLNANGVRMAAEAIAKATAGKGNHLRHRIEHGADFISLDDLDLVERSGALLVTTPQFLGSMTRGIGPSFAPLRTLRERGVALVGGTDSTGTVPASVSVLGNVQTAVTRATPAGRVIGPEQALDVDAAIGLFTTGSSHGTFEDGRRGVIRPGALADFAQLGADPWTVPPTEIGSIPVRRTIVGGTIVHES